MYIEETLNLAEQFRLAIVLFFFFFFTLSIHACASIYVCAEEEEEEEEEGWVERSWNGRNFGLASPIQQPENYGHLPLW